MNGDITSLQAILDQLYQDMLPLSGPLMIVARALAGFFALLTIAYRVWGHIARAEPVDVFPLLRPFALGMAVLLYPALLALINGLVQPVVTATGSMVQNGQQAVQLVLQQQQQLPTGTDTASESLADVIGSRIDSVHIDYKAVLEQGLASLLEWIFEGAVLIISILRTFILIVLSILGPLVLGLSVLDGFRSSFQHWLARYISVSLWLPVANIYGAVLARVQLLMLQQAASPDFAHGQGAAYIIFLLMGIVGYACVPSTAGYIVHALGGHSLVSRANAAARIIKTL